MIKGLKIYSRDKRSPIPKNEGVSKVMRANKNKNTMPEMLLRMSLWEQDLKGYRLHSKKLPGKPDIIFNSKKVAIFVNGCFWHRCPHCSLELPKNNTDFWSKKFEANKLRDANKTKDLELQGWKVATIWECEIKKDIMMAVNKIKLCLGRQL